MRSGVPRVLYNLASLSTMRLVTSGLTFLLVIYIAREWGVTSLGRYALLMNVFLLLQLLPLLGLHLVLIRDVSARPETAASHAVNASALALAVGSLLAVSVGATGAFVWHDESEMRWAMWLVGASAIPAGIAAVAESVLLGQQRMDAAAGWNIAESLVRTSLSFLAVYLGFGVAVLFAITLAGRLMIAAGYYRMAGLRELFHAGILARTNLLAYLKQAPPFLGIVVCAVVLSRLDVIVLAKLATLHDVGLYAAPFRIYEVGLMVPSLLSVVLFPVFSELFARDRERFASLLELTFRVFLLLGAPLVIAAAFLAPQIIGIFGAAYEQSAPALRLLLGALIFASTNQLLSTAMLVSHQHDLDFRALLVTCVVYTLLLVTTIPAWGYLGAAASTVGAAILQPMVRCVLLRGQLPLRRLAGPAATGVLAIGAMVVVLVLMQGTGRLLPLVLGLACYAVVIALAKGVTARHLREYRSCLAGTPVRDA